MDQQFQTDTSMIFTRPGILKKYKPKLLNYAADSNLQSLEGQIQLREKNIFLTSVIKHLIAMHSIELKQTIKSSK